MAKKFEDFVSHVRNKFKKGHSLAYKSPYSRLTYPYAEIRLLQVWRQPRNKPLSFRFMNIALHYQPLYFALSYVWGDPSITENVTINGLTLAVTKNLANALRYIGENLHDLFPGVDFIWLWVDALCINQTDIQEKNFQVQLMQNIYNQAQRVISWIGLEADGKPLALDRIKTMAGRIRAAIRIDARIDYSWLESHPEYCNRKLFETFEHDLRRFLDHEYWSRVWILQEVALAWHVVIMSGPHIIAADDLRIVISWLHQIQRTQPAKPPTVDSVAWQTLTDPLTFSFIDLELHFWPRTFNLGLHFLIDTVRLQATDPRDKVYGLQAISPMGIVVDYKKDTKSVYLDVAKKWIEADSVYPLLCRAGVGLQPQWKNPFDLPSWVPDWQSLSLGRAGNHHQNATFTIPATRPEDAVQFPHSLPYVTAGNNLLLGGLTFDSITNIESDFGGPHGDINKMFSFCAEFSLLDYDPDHEPYPTKIPRLQSAFRLIQAGMLPSNQKTDLHVYELCHGFLYGLAHLDVPFPWRAAELLEWTKDRVERLSLLTGLQTDEQFSESLQKLVMGVGVPCPAEWRGLPAMEVLDQGRRHFRNLHWSVVRQCFFQVMCRRIFHTSKGYLGIGPPGVCDGDIIVVLSGVPWPAVLRKKGSCYQLVGLCCVIDIMRSELWETWKESIDSGKSAETFELC